MSHYISFKDKGQWINNMLFRSLLEFSIETGELQASIEERTYLELMKKRVTDGFFWPGRDVDLEQDFPTIPERKFWSRVFFEIARAIFERKIGVHAQTYWQAQRIYLAYGLGNLFQESVREIEPTWHAETLDNREFDRVVNGRETRDA